MQKKNRRTHSYRHATNKTHVSPLLSKKRRMLALIGIIILFSMGWMLLKPDTEPTATIATQRLELTSPTSYIPEQNRQLSLTSLPSASASITPQKQPPSKAPKPTTYWVKKTMPLNGSLSQLLNTLNLSTADIQAILALKAVKTELRIVYPGQTFKAQWVQQGQKKTLKAIKIALHHQKMLVIEPIQHGFKSQIITMKLRRALQYASGIIHHSLATAAIKAGLSNELIAHLVHIFHNQINFREDIRPGDQFHILFDTYSQDHHRVSNGVIEAAELIDHKKTYQAIRFSYPHHHTGYYSPSGHNLERLFLKAPLHYDHISSYFSYHRMDPILHRIHPHLGVDYAAPYGTPVKAMSDGKIVYIGRKGGYGKAIIIDYGTHYRSLYGHLSRFAKHLHQGICVKKGEIVGFVGDTGWSTGPHLHLSIYVNGIPKNPLHVGLPEGLPIPHHYLSSFKKKAKKLLAALHLSE